jgi:hypothetical protein
VPAPTLAWLKRVIGQKFASGFLLSLLALNLHAQVPPAEWELVEHAANLAYHVDKREVRFQGMQIDYWVTVEFDYGPELDAAKPYRSARMLRHADCSVGTQDTKSFLQYDAPMGQGELVWASVFEDNALRMEPVDPGSLSERLMQFACTAIRSSGHPSHKSFLSKAGLTRW